MNNIDKELDDTSLTGSVIIGLGSNKHGAGLAKIICINTYFTQKKRNRRFI